MIKTALISVHNKEGITDFAMQISKIGIKIISTGNTAKLLKENKVDAIAVSEITKFPEMLDGKVKSLHPAILGGILADKDNVRHQNELKKIGIKKIDLVVVNFYPFEEAVKTSNKLSKIIENIDIGGPTLVRAAAKNNKDVLVIVDHHDYNYIIEKIKNNKIDDEDRLKLAAKAFSYTARYEAIINGYFNKLTKNQFPDVLNLTFKKIQNLRYGENPYKSASFYKDPFTSESCVSTAKQLQGKELSFNNILDVDAAFELAKEFEMPTAAIIKHTNPSGVASASSIETAFMRAYETDSKSAFGCIVALNRNCNVKTAGLLGPLFVEVVICPKFDNDALVILKEKKNLRLMETPLIKKMEIGYDLKKVGGGLLIQTDNCPKLNIKNLKVVTKRRPTKEEMDEMMFAWKVNKHVKSNSIVLAKKYSTVGIGAGQMSRVDAVNLAVSKSEGKCKDAVMSSDAFFPFRDGIDMAAKAGVASVIQPGGSLRDKEVIQAADEHNMAMVFTGIRLFKH